MNMRYVNLTMISNLIMKSMYMSDVTVLQSGAHICYFAPDITQSVNEACIERKDHCFSLHNEAHLCITFFSVQMSPTDIQCVNEAHLLEA